MARWRMASVLVLRLLALWMVVSTIPDSIQFYVLADRTDSPAGLNQLLAYVVGISLWLLAPAVATVCIHPRLWKRLGRAD